MKKVIALILLLALVASLAACGGGGGGGTQAADEPLVLVLGDAMMDGHPNVIAFRYFAELVAERSNGEIEVQVFPASQLGSQREMIEGLRLGTVDIVNTMAGIIAAYVPEINVFDLPFVWEDRDHFYRVLWGDLGQEFKRELLPEFGFEGLTAWDGGIRSVYSNTLFHSMDEMRGLRIRVPEIPIYVDFFEAVGASPTPIPAGEIYSALQTGVVDAAENDPVFILSLNHHEVFNYYILTEHIMSPDFVLLSEHAIARMTDAQVELIREAMHDAAIFRRATWLEQEADALEVMLGTGIQLVYIDRAPFIQRAQETVWVDAERQFGRELIDRVVNG